MYKWGDEFDFSEAPLNKWYHPVIAIVFYLIAINVLEQLALRKRISGPIITICRRIQTWHNFALSLASLIMVTSMIGVFYHKQFLSDKSDPDHGEAFILCPKSLSDDVLGTHKYVPVAKGALWNWVYIFYLSKYWELLDTILQMVRGRRPPSYYFHIWHHTVYLLICYGYVSRQASLAALAVVTNGSVHVIMYYYYYLITKNISPSWKHYITRIQIVQFIFGYYCFARTAALTYIHGKDCNGKNVLLVHAAFNLTMLLGFLRILARIRSQSLSSPKPVSTHRSNIGAHKLK